MITKVLKLAAYMAKRAPKKRIDTVKIVITIPIAKLDSHYPKGTVEIQAITEGTDATYNPTMTYFYWLGDVRQGFDLNRYLKECLEQTKDKKQLQAKL